MKNVSARKPRKASTRRKKRDPRRIARIAKVIRWQVGLCKSTAREAHLRSLMGLPAARERGE